MLRRCRNRQIRLAVSALYALATILLVAGHQPQLAKAAPDLNAFTLPDGTALVLCTQNGLTDGQSDSDGDNPKCEACRLAAAPGLGLVAVPAVPAPSFCPIALTPASGGILTGRLASSTAEARAPPVPHSL